jgi:sugar lactone lactonase YvrE
MRLAAALVLAAVVAAVPSATAATGPCAPWQQKTVKSGLGSLENLEFDRTGGLTISATDQHAIERLTPDGKVTTLVPNVNAPGGQRLVGRGLFFNTGDSAQSGFSGTPDGTLERFDLDSHARRTFASGLTMPNGLAVLPSGDFVVSRDIGSGTGITRVPVTDPAHPQTNWARLDDQNGMAVDTSGTFLYAVQTFKLDSPVYRIRISDPTDMKVVATLGDGGVAKALDDMTIDAKGILYIAANFAGEVIRLDPATGQHCVIVTGLQNPSSVKFGRGPGWAASHLYVTGFDGTVRELIPPATTPKPRTKKKRLALSVRPRTADVGDRTHFRFSVRPRLRGVRVTLAGRRTATNAHGRATLNTTFRHPGARFARASKRGYKAAERRVTVRG